MNAETTTAAPPTSPTPLRTSPTLGKIALALAKAQGEFTAAGKDREANVRSDKGNYSYKFANFASIMEAVRAPLAKHELALTVSCPTNTKEARATALLMHSSGEWLASEPVTISIGMNTPQATGSAIEYARKYAVRNLLNIATDDEDDDGQAAVGNSAATAQTSARVSAKAAAAAKTARMPIVDAKPGESTDEAAARAKALENAPKSNPSGEGESAEAKVVAARTSALWKKAKEEGVTKEEWSKWAESVLQAKKTQDQLTTQDVDQLEACLSELLLTKAPKKDGDVPF